MNSDVLVFDREVSLGLRVKLCRMARQLRQGDVAYLATEELSRRGLLGLRVSAKDVHKLERGIFAVSSRKRQAILITLGLDVDLRPGELPLPPRREDADAQP